MTSRAVLLCTLAILAADAAPRAALSASAPAPDAPAAAPEASPALPFPDGAFDADAPRAWPHGPVFGPEGPRPPGQEAERGAQDRRKQNPPRSQATPDEKARAARAEALKKAMTPHPSTAVLRKQALDALFKRLADAGDPDEARPVTVAIERIWSQSPSDTANLLMERASAAMLAHRLPLALQLFDKLIALEPNWAEAWNKRATLRFLGDDLDGAMTDIREVLKLEPRHFGALAGMGLILQREGLDKGALAVYRKALTINPQQPELHSLVEKLTLEVEGRDI